MMNIDQINVAHEDFKRSRQGDTIFKGVYRCSDVYDRSMASGPLTLVVASPHLTDDLFETLRQRLALLGSKYPEFSELYVTGVDINYRQGMFLASAHFVDVAIPNDTPGDSFDELVDMWLRRWDMGLVITFVRSTRVYHPTPDYVTSIRSATFDRQLFDCVRHPGLDITHILSQMGVTYNGEYFTVTAEYKQKGDVDD